MSITTNQLTKSGLTPTPIDKVHEGRVKKIDEGTRVAWQLFEDDEFGLVLSVLCGDVGIYEVKIKLLDDEVVRYKNDGPSALDEIAYRISRSSN